MKFLNAILLLKSTTIVTAFNPTPLATRQNHLSFYRPYSFTRNVDIYRPTSTSLNLSSDDESSHDDEPLSRGVDSVSWLPSVNEKSTGGIIESAGNEENEVLPLFPLGGIVYTPNSNHVLNIFEPRYRKMYNDILMNGSKRFVVAMSHPSEGGRFAEMGVLFQLEDLKEVSEQTNDQVKFICTHRVTGRVKLHKIINPEAWKSRETYLKVEGTLLDDNAPSGSEGEEQRTIRPSGGDVYAQLTAPVGALEEEKGLVSSFSKLVELQHKLSEDVRFTRASVSTLSVDASDGEDSLWSTIRLWQSYTEQRLVARQNELQKEFQTKLLQYLTKEKGVKEEELPSAIGFRDLSPALQKEVQELQKRMAIELQPLILESTLTMQKILEAEGHKERLNLLKFFVDAETKRLEAKKTLKGMFEGLNVAEEYVEPQLEERNSRFNLPTTDDGIDDAGRILKDEPDAFQ